ncbi:hypothetical protein BO94DRAFT_618511 [Aspergillus sclerotioniger CBS 115572]|uniref:Protein kinase domain-containing protein n=1 Tax=Aspergillus sclerotioniger CBS 115572 TaxID=1450535 RepID=A0A317X3R5_9EURO|nr:hypothetical protein BO94DRAFT_618511 [Aspergillus sclerotioniger CBS 115572]PWY91608.1 hypothetical protein BO94DRAFT_618511 [Aspergillus sclerotioniger CBS 115572]
MVILSVIWTWICNIAWPFGTRPEDSQENPNTQPLQTDREQHNPRPRPDGDRLTEPANIDYTKPSQSSHDPYLGLPVIATGMTGVILDLGNGHAEYMNEINRKTLEIEIQIYQRLGSYEGIICFHISPDGIELPRAQEDLENYLASHPEPEETFKITWILSLIGTFSYIHSHKVFVDDIALHNILAFDDQLKITDFDQSILLPLDTDITSVNENDLTVQIEILHLGWIMYSIASWQAHKYYFFSPENPNFRWPTSFPDVDHILCGRIIKKCWRGEYASMDHVQDEALEFLTCH